MPFYKSVNLMTSWNTEAGEEEGLPHFSMFLNHERELKMWRAHIVKNSTPSFVMCLPVYVETAATSISSDFEYFVSEWEVRISIYTREISSFIIIIIILY